MVRGRSLKSFDAGRLDKQNELPLGKLGDRGLSHKTLRGRRPLSFYSIALPIPACPACPEPVEGSLSKGPKGKLVISPTQILNLIIITYSDDTGSPSISPALGFSPQLLITSLPD